ncbi:MAG: topoisomerase DNA-binding C4 zinc finger domain-containing protein, partial [Candidatus Wildermuthbacteria bacterium]|nr:topoisomerase DNA-binding C4 zinc finger domain-containing protein [Candidatus Wildermuthbacteria bacterium]
CPKCSSPVVIRTGRFGRFYACSAFPKCKHTEPLENAQANTGISCPSCKKGTIVSKKTRKGKIFYACNQYPACDFALWDKPTGELCKTCGSFMVTKGKQVKCSNKECPAKT